MTAGLLFMLGVMFRVFLGSSVVVFFLSLLVFCAFACVPSQILPRRPHWAYTKLEDSKAVSVASKVANGLASPPKAVVVSAAASAEINGTQAAMEIDFDPWTS